VAGHLPPLATGLSVCTGDVIGVLDDDAVPHTGWAKSGLRHFTDDAVVAVGGPVLNHGSVDVRARALRGGYLRWYGAPQRQASRLDGPGPYEVAFLSGGNVLYRSAAVQEVGFDLNLNIGAAPSYELDVGLGLRRLGRLLFDPAVVVDHFPAAREGAPSREDVLRLVADYTHNLNYVVAKRHPPSRRVLFRAYMGLVGQRYSPGWLGVLPAARLLNVSPMALAATASKARFAGWTSGCRVRRESLER
jgi:GT2 family glycosyltransferase